MSKALLRIGFDGSRAFAGWRTGTENYSYQLLKALAKVDQKNTYRVYLRPSTVYTSEVYSSMWPENFQFITLNYPRFWTQVGLAIQTFKEKLDLLFTPAHTLPLIRKPGLKTIITVHDLGAEYLPKMHQVKQRFYLNLMTHYQLKGATRIIAVSKATKKDLEEKISIPSKNIKVIYEGVDRSFFRSVKVEILVNRLEQFDLEKGKYFLFVGTIQPRKNLERLIEAYASFASDFAAPYLVLVGNKGWLSDEIYNLPKKLGIEDRVKFLGRVEDKDLPTLYSGAIALTFPSLFEGFGLPILEAMSCGCPVITSKVSSMPEVVKDAALYVDPYNTGDIAAKMKEVTDPKVQKRLVKLGLKRAEKFSWEKAAKETLDLFEEVNNE